MPGYPDWQAYPQWLGQPLVSQPDLGLAPGTHTLYSGAAPAYASLQVRFVPAGGYGRLKLSWYLDAALTKGMGSDTYLVNQYSGLLLLYPVQAPYLVVSLDVTSTVTITGELVVSPSNLQITAPATRSGVLADDDAGVSVAASSTYNNSPSFQAAGPATWAIMPADTSGKLHFTLAVTDETDTVVYTLWDAGTPTGPVLYQVTLPLAPVVIQVTNTDTVAAHTFSDSLTGAGG